MLFEMLTGRQPHLGDSPSTIAYKHVNEDVSAPSEWVTNIPRTVDELIEGATSRDPLQRPSDAAVFLRAVRAVQADADILPVTIYISDSQIHEDVQSAIEDLLATAGLRVESRDDPVVGSWFRRILAGAVQAVHSPVAREGALIATHIADTRLVLAQDAWITATLLQNLGPSNYVAPAD